MHHRRGRRFLALSVAIFASVVTWSAAEAGFGPAQGSGGGGLGAVKLTGVPSSGQVPTATSATTATWQTPATASLNPTTSIITIGAGLGATPEIVGPSDQNLQVQAASSRGLILAASGGSGTTIVLGVNGINLSSNNGDLSFNDAAGSAEWQIKGFEWTSPGTLFGQQSTNRISTASGNENDLTTDAANSGKVAVKNTGVTVSSAGGVAAVCSVTQEMRFGGTLAQPTQQTQAASVTLDTTAGTWNANSAIAQTYTLPDATTCAGRIYRIKQTGAGALTLATTSSQNVDGSTTYVFPARYVSIEVQSDGAQWWIY